MGRSSNLPGSTACRAPAEKRGLEEVMRTATQAELDGIESRVVAIETSREAIAQSVQEIECEINYQTVNPCVRSESDSVVVNRA